MNNAAPSGSRQNPESTRHHLLQARRGQLHGRGAETIGILAAMGGRAGFVYWLPLLIWAAAVALVHTLSPTLSARIPEYETVAYRGLMWARMGAVFLLWFGGGQLAMALGYRRGQVFRVAAALTLVVLLIMQLLAELASRMEQVLLREGGVRVMVVEDSAPGTWTLANLFEGVLPSAIHSVGFPFVLTVLMVIWIMFLTQMKRGFLWILLLLPLFPVFSIALVLIVGFEWSSPSARAVATAVGVAVAFALVWLGFRRIPVGGEHR